MTLVVQGLYTVACGETVSFRNENGFRLDDNNSAVSPRLVNRGTVQVSGDGPLSGGSLSGVVVEGTASPYAMIENYGSFSVASSTAGLTAQGITSTGGETATLYNTSYFSVQSTGNAYGFQSNGMFSSINNAGIFTVSAGVNAYGIQLLAAGTNFANSGTISVTGNMGAVAYRADHAASFVNSGSIIADFSNGVSIGISIGGIDGTSFINDGRIQGHYSFFQDDVYDTSRSTILNNGSIQGDVVLAYGAESLTNRGTIEGDVYLGGGPDTFLGAFGSVYGTVHGGDGNDQLTGGDGYDLLSGDSGDDLLVGGGGPDVLIGGSGADVFRYDRESDAGATYGNRDQINDFEHHTDKLDLTAIAGSVVSLVSRHGAYTEVTFGASALDPTTHPIDILAYGLIDGFDVRAASGTSFHITDEEEKADLRGGVGDDVIQGGGGGDVLTGGQGADRFVYVSALDSPVYDPDTIADFEHNVDRIVIAPGLSGDYFVLTHNEDGSTSLGYAVLYDRTNALIRIIGDVEGNDLEGGTTPLLYIRLV